MKVASYGNNTRFVLPLSPQQRHLFVGFSPRGWGSRSFWSTSHLPWYSPKLIRKMLIPGVSRHTSKSSAMPRWTGRRWLPHTLFIHWLLKVRQFASFFRNILVILRNLLRAWRLVDGQGRSLFLSFAFRRNSSLASLHVFLNPHSLLSCFRKGLASHYDKVIDLWVGPWLVNKLHSQTSSA